MPSYGAGEELRFLEELLDVVFAEVVVDGVGRLVEGEDVGGGLELGDGYEADLLLLIRL